MLSTDHADRGDSCIPEHIHVIFTMTTSTSDGFTGSPASGQRELAGLATAAPSLLHSPGHATLAT